MVRRAHTIGFAVAIVCLAGVVGSASGLTPPAATGSAAPPDPSGGFGVASDRFATTTFEITAYANGSIQWTTIYTKPLNESEVADFESFARKFNTTETDLFRSFVDLGTGLARVGTNRTNRTMRARGFSRRAYVDRGALTLGTQGRVEMRFLLTNLSRVDGQRVVLGDAFDGGLYLKQSQKLVVEPGPGLAFDRVEPTPDSQADPESLRESDSITWEGKRDFNDERPYVVFAPPSTLTTVATTTSTTTAVRTTDAAEDPSKSPTATDRTVTSPGSTTTGSGAAGPPTGTTPGAQGGGSGGTMLVVGLIVLVLGAGTVAVWRVTTGEDDGGVLPTPGGDGTGTDQPATTEPPEAPAGPQAAESEAPAEQAAPEEELLTDSDRVQQLLDDNGGRMRQSAIVEETDWSKSKVSMLLSDMEDDDEITKLRVGRENIISLPGHEPDAAGSPFEDEE